MTVDVFEHGRLAKQETRRGLLEALTRTERRDTSGLLDDAELIDRLADRVVDRLQARLDEQEGASST